MHAHLCLEVAADGARDALARLDHPTRQRPPAHVGTQDGDQLQHAGLGVEARHNRVACVVGPPLTEEPAASHTGAAARVEREAHLVRVSGQWEGERGKGWGLT